MKCKGEKFGRLILLEDGKVTDQVLCQCECGNKVHRKVANVIYGYTKSCGCLYGEANIHHGRTNTPSYRSWQSMIRRCYSKTSTNYENWGGRGIRVCDAWRGKNGYLVFIKDMGERPEGTSLDRKDNNLGYFKDNCQWSTIEEQNRNQRSNVLSKEYAVYIKRMLEAKEYKQREIAELFNVSPKTVSAISTGRIWKEV